MWQRSDNKVAVKVFLDHLSEDLGEGKSRCVTRDHASRSLKHPSALSASRIGQALTSIQNPTFRSLLSPTSSTPRPCLPKPHKLPTTPASPSCHTPRSEYDAPRGSYRTRTNLIATQPPSKCPIRSRSYRVRHTLRGSHQNAIE